MLECWKAVYRAARVGPGDRVFFPFSFGPFLGFWPAFEAGCQIGPALRPGRRHVEPAAAGDDRRGRRDGRLLHADLRAAAGRGGAPRSSRTRPLVGEQRPRADRRRRAGRQHPGDARAHRAELGRARHRSSRADRGRADQLRVLGAPGSLHLNEGEYICEVLDPVDGDAGAGRRSRASWWSRTSAGRRARSSATAPATSSSGAREPCACGRTWARLEGGILARADDMINIRGVNVYPASIESVVRRFPEVVEFRSTVSQARRDAVAVDRDRGWRRRPATVRRWRAACRSELREALGLTVPVHGRRRRHAAAVRDEGPAVRRGGVSRRMSHRRCSRANPDVVVIGGGPAGSTVSTLIAQQGYRVELFERERFPRFHIGESLIPETYWVLKRLNMLPKMQQSHFVKKYSVQFVNSNGKTSAPFYFWDNKPHECSQTWQVVRSEFDQMMLDNAREHGVDVHEGVRVHDVLFEGDRAVGVSIKDERRHVPRGARARRRRCQRPERPAAEPAAAARLGSDAEQGRDLDLLGRRVSRHRPRRGRDARHPDRQQERLVLVHPAARQHRQRRRRRAVRLSVQGTRRATRRPTTRKSTAARA